jgi:ornithine cyclodeaminase/alanine dehydrogenase
MGFKAFHGAPTFGARYLIAVFEQANGDLLALMDANHLTAARTGATAGVAAKYLARPESRTVGVIGAGMEARANLQAMCDVLPGLERLTVYSPRASSRERFVADMGDETGLPVSAVDRPEFAVRGADVVLVATNTSSAADPIAFRGEWIEEGMHISSIGSTMPALREIDRDTFARSDLIVVDALAQVLEESGDVIDAQAAGAFDPSAVAELHDVAAGLRGGRPSGDAVTLFKSVGTALQDVMSGLAIYEVAKERGFGYAIDELLELKSV